MFFILNGTYKKTVEELFTIAMFYLRHYGGVAQLVEHMTFNHGVGSSSLLTFTFFIIFT